MGGNRNYYDVGHRGGHIDYSARSKKLSFFNNEGCSRGREAQRPSLAGPEPETNTLFQRRANRARETRLSLRASQGKCPDRKATIQKPPWLQVSARSRTSSEATCERKTK